VSFWPGHPDWHFDYAGAMREVQQAMADMAVEAQLAAELAQNFQDAWWRAQQKWDAEWRADFYRHPEDAWWEH
jgi:uncharacterized protein (DUF2267 family)